MLCFDDAFDKLRLTDSTPTINDDKLSIFSMKGFIPSL